MVVRKRRNPPTIVSAPIKDYGAVSLAVRPGTGRITGSQSKNLSSGEKRHDKYVPPACVLVIAGTSRRDRAGPAGNGLGSGVGCRSDQDRRDRRSTGDRRCVDPSGGTDGRRRNQRQGRC